MNSEGLAMKRFSLIVLIALCCFWSAFAIDPAKIYLSASISDGTGTVDKIEDLPGSLVDGIRIYLGYREGEYNSSYSAKELKPLANEDSAVELSISGDDDSGLEDSVTIYVIADSNIKDKASTSLHLDTSKGWYRSDEDNVVAGLPIDAELMAVSVSEEESNVKAEVVNDSLQLVAVAGAPKGEDAKVVGYATLTWDTEAQIPAGTYKAEVKVMVEG